MGTCDPANADPLPRIAGYVRPQRVSDDVDLATCHVIILLKNRIMWCYITKGSVSGDQCTAFFPQGQCIWTILNICVEWNRKLCESFVVEYKYYFCEIFYKTKFNNKQIIKHWKLKRILGWNSYTEFLVKVSGHKRESSQTRDFYLYFSVLQNAIHESTWVFLICGFVCMYV